MPSATVCTCSESSARLSLAAVSLSATSSSDPAVSEATSASRVCASCSKRLASVWSSAASPRSLAASASVAVAAASCSAAYFRFWRLWTSRSSETWKSTVPSSTRGAATVTKKVRDSRLQQATATMGFWL